MLIRGQDKPFYYRILDLQGNEVADRFSDVDVDNPWHELNNDGVYYGLHNALPEIIENEQVVQVARDKNYTIEKFDMRAEVSSTEVINNRIREYPTLEEVLHAILDGGMDEIQARRALVKAKYPKLDE